MGGNLVASSVVYPEQFARPALEPSEWYSAQELADLCLPGLPSDKRLVNKLAALEKWAECRRSLSGEPLARSRSGRGGGLEYHVQLLPHAAREELHARGLIGSAEVAVHVDPRAEAWKWYENLPNKVKTEAERRAKAMADLLALPGPRRAAVRGVAESYGISEATVWTWHKAIQGHEQADWLPALAPRRTGGGKKAEIPEELWQLYKSDWLRLSAPPASASYAIVRRRARELGLPLPSIKAFQRRMERLSKEQPGLVILMRQGREALEARVPSIRRTVNDLQVLEWVNIDGHVFDVEVADPDTGKPIRPTLVAIQDVRSSKILAWRVGTSENAATVRLVFADLLRNHGIPRHITLDNGRGFAAKWLTGGALTRYRFTIRPEDPQGLLVLLGVQIHWARPYHGQSKPIERAWGTMCNHMAKSAEFDGAYTGNSPMNKPANKGSRAIPWAEFCALVDRGIAEHNAEEGRTGRDYEGRSFDQVYNDLYPSAIIRKATPPQLRECLLAVDRKRGNSKNGEITLFGNRYWSIESMRIAGEYVTVRFDPDDLHSEIHIYGDDGGFLFSVPIMEDFGFKDKRGSEIVSKRRAHVLKTARLYAEAAELLDPAEIARIKAGAPAPEQAPLPEPAAVRPLIPRQSAAPKVMAAPRQSESRAFAALGKPRLVE